MAHTKAGGSTQNGRDSVSKRLGVKRYGGQKVIAGNIILRQRGAKMLAGEGTRMGKDNTIYAIKDGVVSFMKKKIVHFTGHFKTKQVISVK